MLRFDNDFIQVECDPKNRIIARETAIPAVVDAFVGKIERREQPHCASKILQSERARSLRHRFEFPIGFRGYQVLETLNQPRFPQSQVVQCFDKRHGDNFAPASAFANTDQLFALKPTAPSTWVSPTYKKSGVRGSGRRCSQ